MPEAWGSSAFATTLRRNVSRSFAFTITLLMGVSSRSSASVTPLWGLCHGKVPLLQFHSEGDAFTKFRNSTVEGNLFMKFRFRSSALNVMSCRSSLLQLRSEGNVSRSSASATPLRRECLAKFRFHNHAVDGSVFVKIRNSAQRVLYHGEVPLPQLCSEVLQLRC